MCDVYRPSAVTGHVLYSHKCAVPTTCQYLHMTNVCRIYQPWERGIINIDSLPLLVVIAAILYPSDSHSILRCWMTFNKAQFSKHSVSLCVCTSIMYQCVPTIRVPAVCLTVWPAVSAASLSAWLVTASKCEQWAHGLCQGSGSQSPAFPLRRPAFGAKSVHVGFVADKEALGQDSLSVFLPSLTIFILPVLHIHSFVTDAIWC
jgi:hypothetical protein